LAATSSVQRIPLKAWADARVTQAKNTTRSFKWFQLQRADVEFVIRSLKRMLVSAFLTKVLNRESSQRFYSISRCI
jgi:hypothetical protein